MALNSLVNRTLETLRGGLGQATRAGRDAANQGMALGKRVANRNPDPKSGMDDVTLARKVESEIFRPANAPKGKVDVNAVDGVVWLRGEVKNQAQVESIEAAVRAIPEVEGVENLLHLPKTPAPSRTRGGAKKTTTKKAQKTKSEGRRFERKTAEEPKSSAKEPLPAQAAATGTGRKPAPLGSKDPEAPAQTTAESLTGGTSETPADAGGSGSGSSSAS
jgi:hypothetical protein